MHGHFEVQMRQQNSDKHCALECVWMWMCVCVGWGGGRESVSVCVALVCTCILIIIVTASSSSYRRNYDHHYAVLHCSPDSIYCIYAMTSCHSFCTKYLESVIRAKTKKQPGEKRH